MMAFQIMGMWVLGTHMSENQIVNLAGGKISLLVLCAQKKRKKEKKILRSAKP
jgi:hypothetical protein